MGNADLDFVRDLEMELLNTTTRSSRDRLSSLLSDDFIEVGKSGKSYNRSNILERIPESPHIDIEIIDFKQRNLSSECIQNLFVSNEEGISVKRTSIWVKSSSGWQMIYHQGTLSPKGDCQ